jgi:hypothetical protein
VGGFRDFLRFILGWWDSPTPIPPRVIPAVWGLPSRAVTWAKQEPQAATWEQQEPQTGTWEKREPQSAVWEKTDPQSGVWSQ